MHTKTEEFFQAMPQAFPLYQAFEEKLLAQHPDILIKVQKTQISFIKKRAFAYVWLPVQKKKNRPANYLIVSFGLSYRVDSPRIVEAVEPYPNRWTHHLIIQNSDEIDSQLLVWIKKAYDFAWSR